MDYKLDDKPNYSVSECKERDATYAAALRVTARLLNKETGEIKESEVFMGDFPLMTESGTFVINGAERVIVSQLVRSPGVYYKMDYDRSGKETVSSTIIPNRGPGWSMRTTLNDVFYCALIKTARSPSPCSSAAWAWARTRKSWISLAMTIGIAPPSRKIPVKPWRRRCLRFTASCAP